MKLSQGEKHNPNGEMSFFNCFHEQIGTYLTFVLGMEQMQQSFAPKKSSCFSLHAVFH